MTTLYISYSLNGKQFIPSNDSKYVISIEVCLEDIEAFGMSIDDFVDMIVTRRLRTNKISTQGLKIGWNTTISNNEIVH